MTTNDPTIEQAVAEVQRRVCNFADVMREKGIHVGINGTCAVCRGPWRPDCGKTEAVPDA